MTTERTGNKVLEKPAVLYDGSCKLCISTTDQLRDFDREHKIDWLDLGDPQVRARFPRVDWERAKDEIHFIHENGRIVTGIRAVHDIADCIGGDAGHFAARALEVPGIREAADVLYHIISENRFKISGEKR